MGLMMIGYCKHYNVAMCALLTDAFSSSVAKQWPEASMLLATTDFIIDGWMDTYDDDDDSVVRIVLFYNLRTAHIVGT